MPRACVELMTISAFSCASWKIVKFAHSFATTAGLSVCLAPVVPIAASKLPNSIHLRHGGEPSLSLGAKALVLAKHAISVNLNATIIAYVCEHA
jgi:hypothetical protein